MLRWLVLASHWLVTTGRQSSLRSPWNERWVLEQKHMCGKLAECFAYYRSHVGSRCMCGCCGVACRRFSGGPLEGWRRRGGLLDLLAVGGSRLRGFGPHSCHVLKKSVQQMALGHCGSGAKPTWVSRRFNKYSWLPHRTDSSSCVAQAPFAACLSDFTL